MIPVRTPETNTVLKLPGGTEENDLPAERVMLQTDRDENPGWETTWSPDDGERKALANGAPIILRIWGAAHPPVSVNAGEPPDDAELRALIPKDHVDRAVGYFYGALAERLASDEGLGTAPEVLELWHSALEETRDGMPDDMAERLDAVEADVRGQLEREDDAPGS